MPFSQRTIEGRVLLSDEEFKGQTAHRLGIVGACVVAIPPVQIKEHLILFMDISWFLHGHVKEHLHFRVCWREKKIVPSLDEDCSERLWAVFSCVWLSRASFPGVYANLFSNELPVSAYVMSLTPHQVFPPVSLLLLSLFYYMFNTSTPGTPHLCRTRSLSNGRSLFDVCWDIE